MISIVYKKLKKPSEMMAFYIWAPPAGLEPTNKGKQKKLKVNISIS